MELVREEEEEEEADLFLEQEKNSLKTLKRKLYQSKYRVRETNAGTNLLKRLIVPRIIKLHSLPADVLWGSFVTHSFGRNECVTNELQRTSAGRL